jgi:hypothetical protein
MLPRKAAPSTSGTTNFRVLGNYLEQRSKLKGSAGGAERKKERVGVIEGEASTH